jgi:hypothetical protein
MNSERNGHCVSRDSRYLERSPNNIKVRAYDLNCNNLIQERCSAISGEIYGDMLLSSCRIGSPLTKFNTNSDILLPGDDALEPKSDLELGPSTLRLMLGKLKTDMNSLRDARNIPAKPRTVPRCESDNYSSSYTGPINGSPTLPLRRSISRIDEMLLEAEDSLRWLKQKLMKDISYTVDLTRY